MAGWIEEIQHRVVEWAPVAAVTFGLTQLWEWRKRIHFAASGWTLRYFHSDDEGNWWYDEEPITESEIRRSTGGEIRYGFTARFFNKKSKEVGLHRISIRFTKGPWYGRTTVFEDKEPSHGGPETSGGRERHKKLEEMILSPHKWTTEDISGLVPKLEQLPAFDNVWFLALTAEGRKVKRKVR